MKISIWNKRPLLATVESTQVLYSPSVYRLSNHILRIVGGDLETLKDDIDEANGPGGDHDVQKIDLVLHA